MDFRVLGSVEVLDGGEPVPPGGPAQRLLLAVLLAHRRSVVSIDALAEALWGDEPPSTARTTLQTHISKLRRSLGAGSDAVLVTRPPGYLLDVDPAAVDADRFAAAVTEGRHLVASCPADAVAAIDVALALWRGPAFAGFADAAWARAEAVRLEELRLVALEDRIDARLALGDHAGVVGELEGLVGAEPLRERLWCQLLVALHRSGRQAEALRAAASFRRLLRDELGLLPSPAFVELEQSIVADPSSAPTPERPPPVAATRTATPTPTAPLVGRHQDLDRVTAAVAASRLVTLTGTGGVGKSAMAMACTRRLTGTFADGVRIVELAPVTDERGVVAAVAKAVDAERRTDQPLAQSVTEVLASRDLLLVLDNCEHVIDAVGALVARILRWCPEVRVLATSREPIGMASEVVRPVAPLAVPADPTAGRAAIADAPAVQVFVARAREAAPGFELTDASAPAVAELCAQLDGLPLALELAAARMSAMTPRQLVDRLGDRFVLLGGGHGRDERQRSLLDVVEWSHDLLSAEERTVLARLSVFAGSFDLEAAEQTCAFGGLATADVAPLLGGLVDKSLVVATHEAGEIRYRQLETLRQFGADRLAERADAEDVQRAHVATFVRRAEAAGAALDGPEEAAFAARLDGDVDNLRAAARAASALGDADAALRLVTASRELAFRRMRYELVDWAEAAVGLAAGASHPLRPTALAVVGYGAFVRGDLHRAVALAEEAIDLRGRLDVASCGMPERVLANALFYLGDHGGAMAWIDRLVEVARSSPSAGQLAHALYMRSVAATSMGDAVGGRELAAEAAMAAERAGSATARAQAGYASGLADASQDPDRAISRLDEAAAVAASAGNRWMGAFAMTEALWLRWRHGEVAEALAGYRVVVETWFRGGDWANQWLSLRHLAGILAGIGDDEVAALLFGAVEAAGAGSALPMAPTDADQLGEVAVALADRLGEPAMAELTRRGAALRDESAVALALSAIDRRLEGDAAP